MSLPMAPQVREGRPDRSTQHINEYTACSACVCGMGSASHTTTIIHSQGRGARPPPPGWLQAGLLYICWDGDIGICFEQVELHRPVRDIEAGDWCAEGKLSSASLWCWGSEGSEQLVKSCKQLGTRQQTGCTLWHQQPHTRASYQTNERQRDLDQYQKMNCTCAVQ